MSRIAQQSLPAQGTFVGTMHTANCANDSSRSSTRKTWALGKKGDHRCMYIVGGLV